MYICTCRIGCVLQHAPKYLGEGSPFHVMLAFNFTCSAGGLHLQGGDSFIPLLLNFGKVPTHVVRKDTNGRKALVGNRVIAWVICTSRVWKFSAA